MFGDIKRLARVAVWRVQEDWRNEALEAGQDYRPSYNYGISYELIESVFWIAYAEYHNDKTLANFVPGSDEESDRFKKMLSVKAYQALKRKLGREPDEDAVRILRHILGHIFAIRRHGRLTTKEQEIASRLQVIKN